MEGCKGRVGGEATDTAGGLQIKERKNERETKGKMRNRWTEREMGERDKERVTQ